MMMMAANGSDCGGTYMEFINGWPGIIFFYFFLVGRCMFLQFHPLGYGFGRLKEMIELFPFLSSIRLVFHWFCETEVMGARRPDSYKVYTTLHGSMLSFHLQSCKMMWKIAKRKENLLPEMFLFFLLSFFLFVIFLNEKGMFNLVAQLLRYVNGEAKCLKAFLYLMLWNEYLYNRREQIWNFNYN